MGNKLKKIGKFIIHNTFGFLMGVLIAGTTVYAATVISGSSISYDNSNSTLSATNVQDALDELTSKTYQCPGKSDELCTYAKVGDYVYTSSMLGSLAIPAALTGYTSDQTINPRELTLWRIIDIKNDGTIDLISEYTSSTPVYFKGKIGIKNYIATLNYISSAYSSMYSNISTRYVGYRGQDQPIIDDSYLGSNLGGSDSDYIFDTNLVQSTFGTLKAYKYGTTEYVGYWLASRQYTSQSSTTKFLGGRVVSGDGSISSNTIYSNNSSAYNQNGVAAYIRPIITLEADACILESKYTGVVYDGTKDHPWDLD